MASRSIIPCAGLSEHVSGAVLVKKCLIARPDRNFRDHNFQFLERLPDSTGHCTQHSFSPMAGDNHDCESVRSST